MSSIQSDGQNIIKTAKTNYNLLYESNPKSFFEEIGPNQTSQFIKNYQTDLKMMSEIGFNGLRQSFSWAKLFPEGKWEKPNQEAINYYHNLLKKMKDYKMTRFMSLMHFELPDYIVQEGGLISPFYVEDFTKFAEFLFTEFGQEVEYFATYNEPFVQCSGMYLTDKVHGMWPLENNLEHFAQAINNVILSHAKIIKLAKEKQMVEKVGIVIDFNPGYARNPQNAQDLKALKYYTAWREAILLDPTIKGSISKEYEEILTELGLNQFILSSKDKKEIRKNVASWLGINYYTPMGIKAPTHQTKDSFQYFFSQWDNPIMLMNKSRGWEIKPQSLFEIIMRIKNNYHNIKMFVTENGIAIQNEDDYLSQGMIHDDYRIHFFKLHLKAIYEAIQKGANIQGYLMWTPIDSWSFMNAYKNRYGLISLDLKTQKRTIKKSGYWWKEMTKERGFEDD